MMFILEATNTQIIASVLSKKVLKKKTSRSSLVSLSKILLKYFIINLLKKKKQD